jgi:hypothetical protein
VVGVAAPGAGDASCRPEDPPRPGRPVAGAAARCPHGCAVWGRHAVGCDGTHGAFPRCSLTCAPCYHSKDANRSACSFCQRQSHDRRDHDGHRQDLSRYREVPGRRRSGNSSWPIRAPAGEQRSRFPYNGEHRRFPHTLQGVGAVGCVTLMITLPVGSVLSGLGMLLVGVGYRLHRLPSAGPSRTVLCGALRPRLRYQRAAAGGAPPSARAAKRGGPAVRAVTVRSLNFTGLVTAWRKSTARSCEGRSREIPAELEVGERSRYDDCPGWTPGIVCAWEGCYWRGSSSFRRL